MLKKLSISLGLTIAVASLLAWPFTYIGINFFGSLAFFITLQFVIFYFYRDYVDTKARLEEQKILLQREAELSKQGAEVTCPCDRQIKAFIPIILNQRNEYVCPGCKKDINVSVKLKTALITTPIVNTIEEIVSNNTQ